MFTEAPEAGWSNFTTAGAAFVTDSHRHGKLWRATFYVSYNEQIVLEKIETVYNSLLNYIFNNKTIYLIYKTIYLKN